MNKLQFWLNRIPNGLIYLLGAIPPLWLFYKGLQNQLGPDPIDVLEEKYGLWALWLLLATLSITPVKRIGLNITKWRRPLGLLCFFYAMAHLLVWLVLDQGLVLSRIWTELVKRPFITIGMISFLLMIPLALTSNNRALRRLGPIKWRRLHRLTYFIALLVPIHFILVIKGIPIEGVLYLGFAVFLIAIRFKPLVKK